MQICQAALDQAQTVLQRSQLSLYTRETGLDVTKPRLLIVGDSFFSRDKKFPNRHWSEMLPDYDVDNRACPGHSVRMILRDLVEGLASGADAVVIGFTAAGRIEFENMVGIFKRSWITSCHQHQLNSDQKLFMTLHESLTDPEWDNIGTFWQIIGALSMLKSQNIPFVYSLNAYQLSMPTTKLSKQHSNVVKGQLSRFSSHALVKNLATYPLELQTQSPVFHVLDHLWQSEFAAEVNEKLKTLDI